MNIKRRESPPGDSVTISPMTAVAEPGYWQASSLFKVQNNTDEVLHQIWVKLTIDHPHIRIQDFTIESTNPTDAPHVDVGQIKNSNDIVTSTSEGSGDKKAKYVVVKRLNPGEIQQFIITKCSPYIPSTRYALHATIFSFGKEPAPT